MINTIKAEVITIGDEILFGQITDTNTQWIGSQLSDIGIRSSWKTSVGDNEQDILHALDAASKRVKIIIITGGLGPTKDDITKHTLCKYFGAQLEINQEALAFVTTFFKIRGREITPINEQQAALPNNAIYIPNQWGTAPGMWFEHHGVIFVSLPGVPYEMKNLMEFEILPRLKAKYYGSIIKHKSVKTIGIGESFLAEKISDWEDALPESIKLAYLPHFGQVRLRLTASGEDEAIIDQALEEQLALLVPQIKEYVFGFDMDNLEGIVSKILTSQGATLSIAESCSGGYVSHMLTALPGSSSFFEGSIISYSNNAKIKILGIKPGIIEKYGAVSEETVIEMVEQVRKKMNTTFAIATTGIAGPGGGTFDKPIGTIWVACASPAGTTTLLLNLKGNRSINIEMTATYVLNLLRRSLISYYQLSVV